jgi:hypothetical protein
MPQGEKPGPPWRDVLKLTASPHNPGLGQGLGQGEIFKRLVYKISRLFISFPSYPAPLMWSRKSEQGLKINNHSTANVKE